MFSDDTRRKIENITSGTLIEGKSDHCTSIRNFLSRRYPPSRTVKKDFEGQSIVKKEQASIIEAYCNQCNLWVDNLPGEDRFLAKGGESIVYLEDDGLNVVKINDGVYYATWLEFLNSILLHNCIFGNTTYILVGFVRKDDQLMAVLKQPFVKCDDQADLSDIRKFLEFNGFINSRRQDYIHQELGLILEDMHDENVLVCQQHLFFIDTVFYTVDPQTLK